jgi:hypothetical protein
MAKQNEQFYCDLGPDVQEARRGKYVEPQRAREETDLAQRRVLGSLILEEGKIKKFDADIGKSLAVRRGLPLTELFADEAVRRMKLMMLERTGRCEVRIRDLSGLVFWAEIRLDGNKVMIRDIDTEKKFEIDGEDILEEMEREPAFNLKRTLS